MADEFEEPPEDADADPVAVAREIVLRQLTVRDRTRSELAEALRKRRVPPEAAEEVLDRFTELGLVNDGAYARAWVAAQQRRMRSKRALRQELIKKGVDRELVDEATESVADDADYRAAMSLAEKKRRSLERLEPRIQYRRLAGALARRGFGADVVARVCREWVRGPDDSLG